MANLGNRMHGTAKNGKATKPRQLTHLHGKCSPEVISQQVAQGSPTSVQIYAESAFRRPFPNRWPSEAPSTYKSMRKVLSGGHFPAGGPERPCQLTNLCRKCPPDAICSRWPREAPPAYKPLRKVLSGGHFPAGGPGCPASVQIYTRSGLRRAIPSRWPREVLPACKSARKVASGGHFPGGGPGRARPRTNLCWKWLPEAIAQEVAQGGLVRVQIYA